MLLTAIVLVLVLLVCWLLFSTVELKIDTRIPCMSLHWKTIGKLLVVFENGDWWLKLYTLPYRNQWLLEKLFKRKKKKQAKPVTEGIKKSKPSSAKLKKMIEMVSSSKVKEWKLAIDTGDFPLNACLFPLNFLPACQQHLEINFINQNFLVLRITNSFWRLLNAWFK